MSDRTLIEPEERRQPGMRRILDAMRELQKEAPGLLDEALTASIELAKRRNGGRLPQ
jgi:hypothetical protein